MKEIKTLGDAWQVMKEHGLEGTYCPHCDQFSQARALLKQDEIIKAMREACITALRALPLKRHAVRCQIEQALAPSANKAKGARKCF